MDPTQLTPEEIKFFETGDASHLQPETPPDTVIVDDAVRNDPPPASEPAPALAPAQDPAPEPDPAVALQELLAQERASRAALEERIAQLAERLGRPPPAPPPAVPDRATDPLGNLFHNLDSLQQTVVKLEQSLQAQTQTQTQQAQFQQFVSKLQTMRDDFAKQTPDFAEAYRHLREVRAADLRDVGLPEADVQRALLQDEIAVSQNALQRGQNPAQVIYNMAKRYGYAPKASAPPPADLAEKIAKISQGQAAAAPPRASGTSDLTIDSLKDMSSADLDHTVKDDAAWRRLMGGGSTDIFHN